MEELKEQLVAFITRLQEPVLKKISEDLCTNSYKNQSIPEQIAETMLKCDITDHFKSDTNDLSGLSFHSVTAGALCDIYADTPDHLAIVILWLTKKPLTQKNQTKLEQLADNYYAFHGDSIYREVLVDYNHYMRNKYVADCADPSQFLDLVKIAIAMFYDPQPLIDYLKKNITIEKGTANGKIYRDWLQFIES